MDIWQLAITERLVLYGLETWTLTWPTQGDRYGLSEASNADSEDYEGEKRIHTQ